ncbi:MAG: nucleotide sugar dehydrogenase [Candidatus Nealsonbacteria bacterium]|nr:nucleotide sugar dehydrogenase [Candidatus Nealsonbacteria bacterium]
MKKVSISGMGKVGLPLSAVIAESGFCVFGVDIDKNRVDLINKGYNPIPEEKSLSSLLKRNFGKRLFVTTNGVEASKEAQIHIIITPLSIDKNKKPDFKNIEDSAKQIALGLKKGDLVVLETTVPVGTTRNVVGKILEKNSGLKVGRDFFLAHSPERAMTGFAISRYQEYPKVVGGIDKKSTKIAANFYQRFCKEVVEAESLEIAEMSKIFEGVFRDINIALANELFKVCQELNINFWKTRHVANYKTNTNILDPGNVGGPCISVYPWFLINNFNVPLIKTARLFNDSMIDFYKNKVIELTKKNRNTKKIKNILVIGISFREGVKEIAYSRIFPLINLLKKNGFNVFAYDPLYSKQEIENLDLKYLDNFAKVDCIVVMNKYPSLRNKLLKVKNKVIDIKNSLNYRNY